MDDSNENQEPTTPSGSVVDEGHLSQEDISAGIEPLIAPVKTEPTTASKDPAKMRTSKPLGSRVPRSPIKASKAQQILLIQLYIRRFCRYFGSFGRMKALSIEVRRRATLSRYTDLRRFHSDYFLEYLELRERTTPYLADEIRDDLAKFTWGQYHWWPKCKDLPTQSQRRKLVDWAVERLAERDFDNKDFVNALDEFCEAACGRPSGG
ncbi:hypothetical protein PV04_01361 [Phialophora macrospora]|uniref:Uncharacterized protein n=1 Tax=Phialophora macrospora TaxID=1851006 RepID=A0A0D2EFU6_9EURO|nr:hypothetical protein PV04_01361 [Phialophora macrospora]